MKKESQEREGNMKKTVQHLEDTWNIKKCFLVWRTSIMGAFQCRASSTLYTRLLTREISFYQDVITVPPKEGLGPGNISC